MNFPKTLSEFYWSIIKKFPVYFAVMFLLGLLIQSFNYLLNPITNKLMFSIFENAIGKEFDQIINTFIILFVLFSVDFIFEFFRDIIAGRKSSYISRHISKSLYSRVYENDTDFFINRPAGQISSKVGEVQRNFNSLTINFWARIIGNTIGFILMAGVMLTMNVWLACMIVVTGIVRAGWQLYRQKYTNKVSKEMFDVSSDIWGDAYGQFGECDYCKIIRAYRI